MVCWCWTRLTLPPLSRNTPTCSSSFTHLGADTAKNWHQSSLTSQPNSLKHIPIVTLSSFSQTCQDWPWWEQGTSVTTQDPELPYSHLLQERSANQLRRLKDQGLHAAVAQQASSGANHHSRRVKNCLVADRRKRQHCLLRGFEVFPRHRFVEHRKERWLQQYLPSYSVYYRVQDSSRPQGSVEIYRPFGDAVRNDVVDYNIKSWISLYDRPFVYDYDDRTSK